MQRERGKIKRRALIILILVLGSFGFGAAVWAYFTSVGSGTGSALVGSASLDHITISPTSTSVVAGQSASYTVTAVDNFNGQTNATSSALLSITNGTCSESAHSCTSLVVGAQTVTASYMGKTATTTQTVSAASTTTSVLADVDPAGYGTTITYTATVAVTSPGSGTPTGKVEFLSDGTAIAGCGGTGGNPLSGTSATCVVTDLPVGTYTITAKYLGGSNYSASPISPGDSETVFKASTSFSITVNGNSSSAAITYGAQATLAESGLPAGATGSVTFTSTSPNMTLCTVTNYPTNTSCQTSATLAAGSYTGISATFSDTDGSYNGSTSTDSVSLTVNPKPENTSTSLSLSSSSTTYGSENNVIFSGTITGQSGDGYPEGTVAVKTGLTTLCTVTLGTGSSDTNNYSCSISAANDNLLSASGTAYSVTASYAAGTSSNGNFTYATSTSGAQSLTVNAESEGTSISISPATTSTTYGSETGITYSGTVTGQNNDGYPEGTVTVKTSGGTTLCTDTTLTEATTDSSTYSCPISSNTLLAASGTAYTVTATYGTGTSSNGDFSYTASTSSNASLTVNAESEGTSISISPATTSTTYGSETGITYSGTVTGQNNDGYPEGTVTVKTSGGTTLCTDTTLTEATTDSSTYSCPISSNTLLAASGTAYTVTATYGTGTSSNGDFSYTASTSSNASLTVNAESEGTSISISPATTSTTYGSETGITYSGTVTGQNNDGYPEGTVTVKTSGGTTLCSVITLGTGSGDTNAYSCPISSNTLLAASGTAYTVTATYAPGATSSSNGDFSYTASTSSNASLTVNAESEGTSISISPATTSTTYGSETGITYSGTVTGQNNDGYPEGTVTVKTSGGTTLCTDTTLTEATTDSSTYSCPISSNTLLAASGTAYTVTATYGTGTSSNGDFSYTASTSSNASLTVNAESEGTSISISPATTSTTYGSETGITYSGTVTGQNNDGYPEGTVTVKTSGGTTLCSVITLGTGSGDTNAYSCPISSNTLLAASGTAYTVTATYGPGGHLLVQRRLQLHRLHLEQRQPDGDQVANLRRCGYRTDLGLGRNGNRRLPEWPRLR